MPARTTSQPMECRLDLWLWAARFYKTRSLAKSAIVAGRVKVNEQAAKPARTLRTGDRLELQREGEHHVLTVVALSEVRGPASVAALLYSESPEHLAARLAARELKRFEALGMRPPDGKPDKRARRLLLALGDIEAS